MHHVNLTTPEIMEELNVGFTTFNDPDKLAGYKTDPEKIRCIIICRKLLSILKRRNSSRHCETGKPVCAFPLPAPRGGGTGHSRWRHSGVLRWYCPRIRPG